MQRVNDTNSTTSHFDTVLNGTFSGHFTGEQTSSKLQLDSSSTYLPNSNNRDMETYNYININQIDNREFIKDIRDIHNDMRQDAVDKFVAREDYFEQHGGDHPIDLYEQYEEEDREETEREEAQSFVLGDNWRGISSRGFTAGATHSNVARGRYTLYSNNYKRAPTNSRGSRGHSRGQTVRSRGGPSKLYYYLIVLLL